MSRTYDLSLEKIIADLPEAERALLERDAAAKGVDPLDAVEAMIRAGLNAAARAEGDPPHRIERRGGEILIQAAPDSGS